MASAPAWQTDELGEEWVETSPSPPGSPEAPPPMSTSKRGSLRSLGAGVARPLPPSRKGSASSVQTFGGGRTASNPYMRSASGMLSPPTSASGSEGDVRELERELANHNKNVASPPPSNVDTTASEVAPGTFLVKDGEDNHGKAFPKNPFQKDMFSALALEKMFEPPASQPAASSSTGAALTNSTSVLANQSLPPVAEEERSSSTASGKHESDCSTPTSSRSSGTFKAVSPVSDSDSPSSAKSGSSGTPSSTNLAPGGDRRVSHPYAPVNPSRLSKSVTPSDSSFATTTEQTNETSKAPDFDASIDDGPTFEYDTHTQQHIQEGHSVDGPTLEPSSHAQYMSDPEPEISRGTVGELTSEHPSPINEQQPREQSPDTPIANPKYPFTFTAPVQGRSDPVFEPSLEPLQGGEPSSSTLRRRPVSSNVGLRLFRNTYDTYTREQLSALVDSIAVQPSPSPPAQAPTKLREWTPADSETPLRSVSSGSASTPASGSSTDARSSKRLRLSPPSPRRPTAVRDWRAHGRAMMDRIRVTDPEVSVTSESRSGTGSWGSLTRNDQSRSSGTPLSDGASGYSKRTSRVPTLTADAAPTFEYSTIGPSKMVMSPSELDNPGQFKSNPSTASSTYLHRAEDMMSRIKSRVVSPSTSTTVESPLGAKRNLSESSRETWTTSESDERVPLPNRSIRSAHSTAPRSLVVHPPSESDESRDMSLEDEESEGEHEAPMPAIQRSGSSRASVEGAGRPSSLPVNRDDLNRFISASTYTTGTTVSASFVKHPGPRDPALVSAMTQIRPGDVQDVLAERVGKMRLDRVTMRWVRDANGSLGRVDEAGESRAHGSEDSVDIFAGIESIGSGERTRASSMAPKVEEEMDESDTTEDDVERSAELTPRASRHLEHPKPHHSASAPPALLKTPGGPATPGPSALRSALRNPNSTPASAMKKQAAWHPDLTPAPQRGGSVDRNGSAAKRSVSFSDNYIAPLSAGGTLTKWPIAKDDDLFLPDATSNGSFLPSTRTRRIQDALQGMAEMSLDATPTKPPQRQKSPREPPKPIRASQPIPEPEAVLHEETDEDTVDPVPFGGMRSFRSFRSRGGGGRGDATFLTECSFGVAHDRLVQLITDVQPFEPYWEQLRTIDLSNKGVESLARLKEFLPALDEALLDNNAINYLSGVPDTVRTLHVAGNLLTSLTSVNHLRNLQYLDISRNQLDSVAQLECLRHLRELKADNNAITDLSGILSMDSLLKLSVSGNKLSRVDLTNSKWERLENLNLSNNQLISITGLHTLKSVSTLNLDKNRLIGIEVDEPLQDIRVLRFSDNDVTHIDLSFFPKVRTLFADSNALPGLSRSRSVGGHRIENLSVRNQRVGRLSLSAEDLQSVKRLYVSGNRLDADFLPRNSPLFHLVYLEAAACNLNGWPANFAQRTPNLRVLNVNYNFLADLDGLEGMVWLRKFMCVGNRLGGSGPGAVRGLKGLIALEEIDLRMNPATLSFYLPIMLPSKSPTSTKSQTAAGTAAPADGNWPGLDAQFRRQLPDEWYSKRLVYRGLIMRQCPDLKLLDGVKVQDAEKRKATMLLEYAAGVSS